MEWDLGLVWIQRIGVQRPGRRQWVQRMVRCFLLVRYQRLVGDIWTVRVQRHIRLVGRRRGCRTQRLVGMVGNLGPFWLVWNFGLVWGHWGRRDQRLVWNLGLVGLERQVGL